MTWPIALLLIFAGVFALAIAGSIAGMLGLAISDALERCFLRLARMVRP